MTRHRFALGLWSLLLVALLPANTAAAAADDFPPGWLPISRLAGAAKTTWREVRDDPERIQLYFPNEKESVRGVFVCFVFHSGDPRELADLWNFALVTVPWPFEYDLGHNDKRNGRYKLGHASQDMGLLLRYLDHAASETKHPELSTVPIVGWLGQNGSHLCADLYERAPERVLAWSDSFPNRLRQYPKLTQNVPFAFAWEISKKELREGERRYREDEAMPHDLSCRANTYGFGHGIYSKFNFFMLFLDRCIQLRMPDQMPPPGEPVKLKKVVRANGWVGDFDPIGCWNPILGAAEKGPAPKYPVWLPDEYAAWSWRSYHSACDDIVMTAPREPYSKRDGKWGGPRCGLGYGGPLAADEEHTFSAKLKSDAYEKVVFHDGHRVLGEATETPWTLDGVKLEPGLRILFAVGVKPDGTRAASRPAIAIVE